MKKYDLPGDYFEVFDNQMCVNVVYYYTCPKCGNECSDRFTIEPSRLDEIKNGGWFEESTCSLCHAICKPRYWSNQLRER